MTLELTAAQHPCKFYAEKLKSDVFQAEKCLLPAYFYRGQGAASGDNWNSNPESRSHIDTTEQVYCNTSTLRKVNGVNLHYIR